MLVLAAGFHCKIEPSTTHFSEIVNSILHHVVPSLSPGSPVNELVFSGPRDKELLCTLSLTNTSRDCPAVFKIKTTAPRRYKVRPNLSLVQPEAKTKVQVLLVAGSPSVVTISDDKFLVQIFSFQASATIPSPNQLPSFWKSLSEKDITEHRYSNLTQ